MDLHQRHLVALAAILVLGVAAQWLAWRLRWPAILLLLVLGCGMGPVAELVLGQRVLDVDLLLGNLIFPIVSISVAIIMFEGGLTLRFSEFRRIGGSLVALVTLGAAITWVLATAGAYWVLGVSWQLALLVGAILVVTGPTVVGPLLRQIRPVGNIGALLKWEGIIIDPIGATLALLVYESLVAVNQADVARTVAEQVGMTLLVGVGMGTCAAAVLVVLLKRFLIPDHLQSPMALALVLAAFVGSNLIQSESGLLTVTAMGIIMANQRMVAYGHILEFKESLTAMLISSLFVILGARMTAADLSVVDWRMGLFLAGLIVVVRPVAVLVSTLFSSLSMPQRLFACGLAPRGIVAAAVASIFALRLGESGIPDANLLVPIVFSVIVFTVAAYGLGAFRLARRLQISQENRRGFLIAGANPVAIAVGKALRDAGREVLLVDTSAQNVQQAQFEGLAAKRISIIDERLAREIEPTSLGILLAMTPNTDVNSLAALHYARVFGRSNVFEVQIATASAESKGHEAHDLHGRRLFPAGCTFQKFADRLSRSEQVVTSAITGLVAQGAVPWGHKAVPLLRIGADGAVEFFTLERAPSFHRGDALVTLEPVQEGKMAG